ncbi:MAG: signal peptidase I [Velocimicrobium sp.]
MMLEKYKKTILMIIAITILIGTFVYDYSFEGKKIEGDSMENCLNDSDYIIINKLSYRLNDPNRYDVIVFPYNKDKTIYYVKRIIGLPGETVQIINSSIYIDGKLLNEFFGKESMDEYTEGIAKDKIVLGDNEYFVLGDNRNNSTDSRDAEVGLIKKRNILGKAVFRIYPFPSFGRIRS